MNAEKYYNGITEIKLFCINERIININLFFSRAFLVPTDCIFYLNLFQWFMR